MEQEQRYSRSRSDDSEEEGDERRGYVRRKPVFQFGANNGEQINYKNVEVLRQLINERGKIRPRRQTGASARFQRKIAIAVKRARHLALIPFDNEANR